jgi:hypothetical protein
MRGQIGGLRASHEELENLYSFEPEADLDFGVRSDSHVFGLLAEGLMP